MGKHVFLSRDINNHFNSVIYLLLLDWKEQIVSVISELIIFFKARLTQSSKQIAGFIVKNAHIIEWVIIFVPWFSKQKEKISAVFLSKVRLKGGEKLDWGVVSLWWGIFWNETPCLDVILYAIHGKEETNLLQLTYGGLLCHRAGPL